MPRISSLIVNLTLQGSKQGFLSVRVAVEVSVMLACSAPTVPVAVKVRVTASSATLPSPVDASSKISRLEANTTADSVFE